MKLPPDPQARARAETTQASLWGRRLDGGDPGQCTQLFRSLLLKIGSTPLLSPFLDSLKESVLVHSYPSICPSIGPPLCPPSQQTLTEQQLLTFCSWSGWWWLRRGPGN